MAPNNPFPGSDPVTLAYEYPPMSKSRRGRPRKPGARFPGGKLKPVRDEGNERVRADRERLLGPLGGLHRADHPLDLALARGWIGEDHHKAGMAFARVRRQAGLGSPSMGAGGLREAAPPADIDKRAPREWTDAETAAVFDAVFNKAPSAETEGKAADAMARWLALNAVLTAAERQQVTEVCVHASWPQWVIWRAAEPATLHEWLVWAFRAAPWEAKRDVLIAGLEKIAKALRPVKRAPIPKPVEPAPVRPPRPRGPKLNDTTTYVDSETSEPILTVVRRTRAASELDKKAEP